MQGFSKPGQLAVATLKGGRYGALTYIKMPTDLFCLISVRLDIEWRTGTDNRYAGPDGNDQSAAGCCCG